MKTTAQDFEKFIAPFLEEFPPAQGLDARIADLEIDSLSFLEMIQAVDDEYDVVIDLDAVGEESTLRQLFERFIQ